MSPFVLVFSCECYGSYFLVFVFIRSFLQGAFHVDIHGEWCGGRCWGLMKMKEEKY